MDTKIDVSGATQPVRGEWHKKKRSSLKNLMKFARNTENRSDDVMQRSYRWSPDLDVLVSYCQVNWSSSYGGTSLSEHRSTLRDAVEKRTSVLESDRQVKRSNTDVSELVNELMHLGAAIGPRLRDGCPHWKIGIVGKTTVVGKLTQNIMMSEIQGTLMSLK